MNSGVVEGNLWLCAGLPSSPIVASGQRIPPGRYSPKTHLKTTLLKNPEPTEPDREDGADTWITGTKDYLCEAHLID